MITPSDDRSTGELPPEHRAGHDHAERVTEEVAEDIEQFLEVPAPESPATDADSPAPG